MIFAPQVGEDPYPVAVEEGEVDGQDSCVANGHQFLDEVLHGGGRCLKRCDALALPLGAFMGTVSSTSGTVATVVVTSVIRCGISSQESRLEYPSSERKQGIRWMRSICIQACLLRSQENCCEIPLLGSFDGFSFPLFPIGQIVVPALHIAPLPRTMDMSLAAFPAAYLALIH
jgi:hypothetical protein